MLSCQVRETFQETYFKEYLQTATSGGVLWKSPFLKTLQYLHDKVASDKRRVLMLINISCKKV